MRPSRGWALCAAAVAVAGQRPILARNRRPRLHVVTFMDKLDRHFAYLQVSAQAHALTPTIIGYGMDAWWPDGLGTKVNALRRFVMDQVDAEDVVLFADAFDVLIFGSGKEIITRFEELEERSNKSLVFNAEEYCFPKLEGVCDEQGYPSAPHRWRYLNSGVVLGRGRALKSMLRDPVPDIIKGSDQFWYQQYFRSHRDMILLDTGCFLACAVTGDSAESSVALRDGRVAVLDPGTMPSIVHFVSVSHWPTWRDGEATSALHEVFRHFYPLEASRLLDKWRLGISLGSTHSITVYDGVGWWRSIRMALCLNCRVLGSRHNECQYFPSLFDMQCWPAVALLASAATLLPLLVLRCVRRHRQGTSPDSPKGDRQYIAPTACLGLVMQWLGIRTPWAPKLPKDVV